MEHTLLRIIHRKEYQEIHIQLIPKTEETSHIFTERIAEIICRYNANIIRATFFGRLDEKDNTIKQLEIKLSGIDFPYSWIEGDSCSGSFINGVYIFAVSGIDVKRIFKDNSVIGSGFKAKEAEYCFIGGLYSDPDLSSAMQTERLLNSTENILNQEGLSFENTIRTWYYLNNILDWYPDFNKARTSFFRQHDMFNKRIPASTGIDGRNCFSAKICFELMAIMPKSNEFSIEIIDSPLQCSANNYGSSFSRAMQYSDSEYSNMTVSGTASIGPDGKTMHINDINKQIELSFRVVDAILKSQNYSSTDIIRAYAYCRDKSFSKAFYEYLRTSEYDGTLFICTENKICRDDLLFEIEVDVIKKRL